jgi:hypothetical protein
LNKFPQCHHGREGCCIAASNSCTDCSSNTLTGLQLRGRFSIGIQIRDFHHCCYRKIGTDCAKDMIKTPSQCTSRLAGKHEWMVRRFGKPLPNFLGLKILLRLVIAINAQAGIDGDIQQRQLTNGGVPSAGTNISAGRAP